LPAGGVAPAQVGGYDLAAIANQHLPQTNPHHEQKLKNLKAQLARLNMSHIPKFFGKDGLRRRLEHTNFVNTAGNRWHTAKLVETSLHGQGYFNPADHCGLKAYQFINYNLIFGVGGTLCYRVELCVDVLAIQNVQPAGACADGPLGDAAFQNAAANHNYNSGAVVPGPGPWLIATLSVNLIQFEQADLEPWFSLQGRSGDADRHPGHYMMYGWGLDDVDPCPLTNNLNPANPRTCNPETCTSAPYTGTDWNLGCLFCDQIARQAFIVTKTTSDPAKHGFFDIYTTIARRQTDSYASCSYVGEVLIFQEEPSPPPPPPVLPPPPPGPPVCELTKPAEVVPFAAGGGAASTSATSATSTASFGRGWHGWSGITCYQFQGIRCHILYHQYDEVHHHGVSTYDLTAPSGTGHHVVVSTSLNAAFPDVATFDQSDAVVCYTVGNAIVCNALKLQQDKQSAQGEQNQLSVGTPVTVRQNSGGFVSVATFDGRGAPPSWAARRAVVCYLNGDVQRGASCHVLSLSFPPSCSDCANTEDSLVAGILTQGPAVVAVAGFNADFNSRNNYPGPRFHDGHSLSTFDFFNGILCYTRPLTFVADFPVANRYWYHGKGECIPLSIDIATGTQLTMGSSGPESIFPSPSQPGGNFVTDLAVQTFKPKSGDPTRALFCYVTLAYAGTHRRGTNVELYCDVAQRDGAGLNYLNSQRGPDGRASAGVNKGTLVESASFVKDTSIAAIDESNAIVCYTVGANIPQCAFPAGTRCPGGASNGFRPNAGNGVVTCRSVWIEGYGSSTYNSNYFNGVASAAEPVNVGSVTAIKVGPPLAVSPGNGQYPSIATLAEDIAVVCYTQVVAGVNRGMCAELTTCPVKDTVAFAAPVDCVNGYNCPHPDHGDVTVRSKAAA